MIYHLQVPRSPYSLAREGQVARACDPVLSVRNQSSLTTVRNDVTCKRCVLTRAFKEESR